MIQSTELAHPVPPPTLVDHRAFSIWGMTPRELHDAYWRGRGVQCIRPGDTGSPDRAADLYLLLDPDQLVLFDLAAILEHLAWRRARLTHISITTANTTQYSERIMLDPDGLVERIQRTYETSRRASRRLGLTMFPRVAEEWLGAEPGRAGWKQLRRSISVEHLDRLRLEGHTYEADDARQAEPFLRDLIGEWERPDQALEGIREVQEGVWAPQDFHATGGATLIGPLWIGFAGELDEATCLVGPGWLQDEPESRWEAGPHVPESTTDRPRVLLRDMVEIESGENRSRIREQRWSGVYPVAKRTLDLLVSAAALVVLSPLFLLIAILIWRQDGMPIFYRHRRQSRGGREFDCLKFRTMHNNAEQMVAELQDLNRCDGPQVYIENDPRVTPIGHRLRNYQLDELPQLWNVLKGDMSLVGPRPSPDRENQYCPTWREVRLSVRPGITGLWQLKRTREPGQDFQEWIRYDIQYVREASFWLDLSICFKTARMVLTGRKETHANE